MEAGTRSEKSALQQCDGYGIYYGRGECPKKKFKGFPLFFIFKILKTAFLDDIKQWASRHRRHRHRYRRRHRRSRSKVENKNVGHGKLKGQKMLR
jgi:hypothetical protein